MTTFADRLSALLTEAVIEGMAIYSALPAEATDDDVEAHVKSAVSQLMNRVPPLVQEATAQIYEVISQNMSPREPAASGVLEEIRDLAFQYRDIGGNDTLHTFACSILAKLGGRVSAPENIHELLEVGKLKSFISGLLVENPDDTGPIAENLRKFFIGVEDGNEDLENTDGIPHDLGGKNSYLKDGDSQG